MQNRQVVYQFTDTHLYQSPEKRFIGINSTESFNDVVTMSLERFGKPDACILTGDISQDETLDSYLTAFSIVKRIGVPAYAVPGNHDDPLAVEEALVMTGAPFSTDKSVRLGKWLCILLDSTLAFRVEGELAASQLEHLERSLLENRDCSALVFLHHNPISLNTPWLDRLGLQNPAELFAVLDRYDNVKAVVCGHVHREFESSRAKVRLLTTPSTSIQFTSKAGTFAIDPQPPGFRRLVLHPDGRLETSVHRLAALPHGLDVGCPGY